MQTVNVSLCKADSFETIKDRKERAVNILKDSNYQVRYSTFLLAIACFELFEIAPFLYVVSLLNPPSAARDE